MFDLLTFEWFLPKAGIGLAVGYVFRMLEHWAWGKETGLVKTSKSFWLFSLSILTQSVTIGLPLSYLILLFIAKTITNDTVILVSAYLMPLLTGFIAVDVRELVRRIMKV